jgi:hypothetical protein
MAFPFKAASSLVDVDDHAAVTWPEREVEPGRFPESRHRNAYRRSFRSVARVELDSARRLPVGFDEEE